MSRYEIDETLRKKVDAVWKVYEPKFRTLLERIGEVAADEGWTVLGVDDFTDEEYELGLSLRRDTADGAVRLTLAESAVRGDDPGGVAFSLGLDAACGHVIGGMTPYNYSDELWISVDNADALATRWELFEGTNIPLEAIDVLTEHVDTCRENG